jgi:hypothetical protein
MNGMFMYSMGNVSNVMTIETIAMGIQQQAFALLLYMWLSTMPLAILCGWQQ